MVIFPFLIWALVTQNVWFRKIHWAVQLWLVCFVVYVTVWLKNVVLKSALGCAFLRRGIVFLFTAPSLLWVQCLAHNKYFVNICSMEKGRNGFPLISQHQPFVAFRSEPLHPHSLQMSAGGTISTLLWQGNSMHRGLAFCVLSSLKYRMDFQAWETMLITNVNHLGQVLMMERKPNRCKGPAALERAERTAPEVLSYQQWRAQPDTLTFPGQPCYQVFRWHHRTCLSWYKKRLKISFKVSQTYRKGATVV